MLVDSLPNGSITFRRWLNIPETKFELVIGIGYQDSFALTRVSSGTNVGYAGKGSGKKKLGRDIPGKRHGGRVVLIENPKGVVPGKDEHNDD